MEDTTMEEMLVFGMMDVDEFDIDLATAAMEVFLARRKEIFTSKSEETEISTSQPTEDIKSQETVVDLSGFAKLPGELRNMIWEYAFQQRRLVEFYEKKRSLQTGTPFPALLHVNQESRSIGLMIFKPWLPEFKGRLEYKPYAQLIERYGQQQVVSALERVWFNAGYDDTIGWNYQNVVGIPWEMYKIIAEWAKIRDSLYVKPYGLEIMKITGIMIHDKRKELRPHEEETMLGM